MKNILFYDLAMETQKADPQFIVYFVNQYRDRLDLQSMETVLGWMSYTDLIDYFESASSKPLLGQSPLDLTTVMDGNATLGRWRPADLKEISSGIYLRFDAAQAWDKMSAAASADGISLVPENGYMSVEQQQSMKDYASYPQGPYGTREEQLGLTVHLQGFDGWNETLSSQKFDEDYTPAMEELSDEQKNEIEWLNRNAWKYGWIIRYPQGKEKITGMNYQPFVLRYVGVPAARSLQEQKKALEEYKK